MGFYLFLYIPRRKIFSLHFLGPWNTFKVAWKKDYLKSAFPRRGQQPMSQLVQQMQWRWLAPISTHSPLFLKKRSLDFYTHKCKLWKWLQFPGPWRWIAMSRWISTRRIGYKRMWDVQIPKSGLGGKGWLSDSIFSVLMFCICLLYTSDAADEERLV